MGSTHMELSLEKECTPRCHSRQHAEAILNAVTKGSAAEIRAFCNWLCYNFTSVTDARGRNILHFAASCDKWEVIEWLLDHCHCDVDVRDAESGWSALHRSFFYGQLNAAQTLLNHGANLRMTDHEGLTPLDLVIADRLPYIEYNKTYPQDVYVWGSNINYNLGLGNEQSRSYAEGVEFFRKENINIQQVVMCKFHTVFLTNDGRLFTCGHGHGGRLGQGSEVTGLTPSSVHGLGNTQCLQVAAGQDHLILLMAGNQVWTCGLNTYHQLGHNPPSERLVTPRPISLKFLKGKQVVGVCAGRFHSVFYTKDSIFTFGLNAGQLGHPKGGERTQIVPRQVSGVYNKDWLITEVVASDGATVCTTNQGDVYVLHEFQNRKIASKQIGIQKLSVIGGHLDSSCDAAGIREGGGLELRVMLLTRTGKLYLWRQTNPFLRRCLFTSNPQLVISDIHLNHYYVAMVTEKNQCYMGNILPFRGKKISTTGPSSPPVTPKSPGINFLLDRDECYNIRAKRVANIHRATFITSDSKGRNFAVLQASPKMGLLELPSVSECNLQKDMSTFLDETNVADAFHDTIITVGQKQYAAHKYILASRSEYFKKHLTNAGIICDKTKLQVENVKPEAFEQVLKFLYCNTCDFLMEGHEVKWMENAVGNEFSTTSGQNKNSTKEKKGTKKMKNNNEDSNNPIKCVQEASRRFNVHALTKILENVRLLNGKIHIKTENQLPKLRFDCQKLTEFCDIRICSEDGVEFLCHKCILAARSDYFQSMLGSCWLEEKRLGSLSLPIPSRIMEIILHYLYTDVDSRINALDDPELLCNILAIADQLLMMRLKEMCEATLVSLVTLKNACELLQLAIIYNAAQLKTSCMEYICINLPAVIEARNLDALSDSAIEELSKMYRCMVSSMRRRIITPSTDEPNRELLKEVEKCYPIQEDCDIIKHKIDTSKSESKSKARHRTNSQRGDVKESLLDSKPRHNSESSEKDISLDIEVVTKAITIEKEVGKIETSSQKSDAENRLTAKKPGQWIMSCPISSDWPSLKNMMMEEKRQMTVLQKTSSSHSESRKMNHMSQKQKKLLAAANKDSGLQSPKFMDIECARSPPICPWAKTVEQSPTSHSFWDAVEKGALQSSLTSLSNCSSESPSTGNYSPMSPMHKDKSEPLVLSLEAIQKAEEKEQQYKSVTAKIKSLHLINIEDQAIEELLEMYKAKDNPRERVSVSRILPERTANPVWKKRA